MRAKIRFVFLIRREAPEPEEAMMKPKTYGYALLVLAFLIMSAPHARADSCDDAKDAAQKYTDSYEEIRQLDVDALKRLVKAVCDADADEQVQVFRDEAQRVESLVLGEKSKLDTLKAEANSKLTAAISDDQCRDKRNNLSDLQKRVEEISGRIEKISNTGVKLGSNPAFDKLRELSQEAHNDYYSHNSKCAPYRDIRVGDLKPDCLDPDACLVIELKPDNSRAADKGWSAAKQSRDLLNEDKGFDATADKNSSFKEKFSQCKGKFKARVDCYHYCPDVDDEGNLKSTSLGWATCKSE